MAIKIIDEPDVHITRAQYERYHREWEACMSMHAFPVSFEVWVRGKLGLVKNTGLRERIKEISNG